MGNNNDYSSLYSSAPEELPEGELDRQTELEMYEQRELARKGKIKVMIIGILYLILCAKSILDTFSDLSQGIAFWIGEMAAMVLFTVIGVMFIKGKNGARIALGVLFCISTAISLLILIPADYSYFKEAGFNAAVLLVAVVSTLIPLGFCGALIYFTLFDKSVKAYCSSKKAPKN